MYCDINGWSVLADELDKHPGAEVIVQDFLGYQASYNNIAFGKYMLSGADVLRLFELLQMKNPQRLKMLDAIITHRTRCGKLKKSADICRLFRGTVLRSTKKIPCARLSELNKFSPGTESLSEYLSNAQENFVEMVAPPGSCALEVSGGAAESLLHLPEGTLIIVDGDPDSTVAETMLFQYYNGRYSMGKLPPENLIKWSVPVLRIHFRQLPN